MTLARAGRGRLVMLAGEPGIGKTRIAQRVAEQAAGAGMLVLWGRCPEEPGAPPYWAWRQIIRRCVGAWDDTLLQQAAGGAAGDLRAFDPELARRLAGSPLTAPSPPFDAAGPEARFRLFDAVAGFWQRTARRQPLLQIFDDLHRADVPTLRLLEFVAAEIRDAPMMILGTYRDAEVTRSHPLSEALSQASRHVPLQRVKLGGFTKSETAQFIDTVAEGWAPKLAAVLHERTDGHPLFLVEMARYLEETYHGATRADEARLIDLARLPGGARDVIGSRLTRLSLACSQVLGYAAAIGRRFSLELLLGLLDQMTDEQCVEALDEACRASLIEPLAEADTYQFTHALIREALYDEMPARRRARLHERIATALEEQHSADHAPVLSALAYHFFEARAAGMGAKAVEFARRAAQQATASVAYEEAVAHYQHALQALGPALDAERCNLLIALGEAQTKTGETQQALATFADAAKLARELHASAAVARAALGYELVSWRGTNVAVVAAALVKEALIVNSPLDSPQRALLFAALCRALAHAGRIDAAVDVHRVAIAMARRVGDPHALFMALAAIVPASWVPELLPARLAAGREAMQIAVRAANPELAIDHLTGWHIGDLMEAGDVDGAARAAEFGADTLSIRRQPFAAGVLLNCRAMISLHAGRFDEAEELVQQSLRHATRFNLSVGLGAASVQMFTLRREQGRLSEIAPTMELFRRAMPEGGTWQPGYALLCCELGHHADALAAFERVARDQFGQDGTAIARGTANWAYLAETCAWLGDVARAGQLYDLITPYRGRNMMFGSQVVCYGSADRLLGLLAATMLRWDTAEQHFETALVVDTSSRGHPWLAHSRCQYAAMLLERNRAGDAQRAAPLLEAALKSSREMGMGMLEQRVLALLDRRVPGEPATYPAGLSPREVQVLQMVAEGKTNQEIATALFRSANTVANHVRNILAKIGAANRTEAAAFAVHHGLVKRP